MQRLIYLVLFALLFSTPALAKPTADAVKSVLDHYNSGSEVILVDYRFCSEIAKEGDNKNECVDSLDPSALHKGDKVYLWMNYLVPKNLTPKVLVQFKNADRTLKTRNLSLTGSFRYRTWALVPTDRAGDWQVVIEQDHAGTFAPVETIQFKVRTPN